MNLYNKPIKLLMTIYNYVISNNNIFIGTYYLNTEIMAKINYIIKRMFMRPLKKKRQKLLLLNHVFII